MAKKPWGREVLLAESAFVACWLLDIKAGHSTSLHSHPNTLTGYIVVEGSLRLSFLNGHQNLTALDKVVIHRAVPHRSTGLTDCKLIEIQCPKDHNDIIRFEDDYGRAGEPMDMAAEPSNFDFSADLELEGGITIGRRKIAPGFAYFEWLDSLPDGVAIAVLSGYFINSDNRAGIVPGHVDWSRDLKRLTGEGKVLVLDAPLDVLIAWDGRPKQI